MPKIVPHLWYDKQAREAAEFYLSIFGNGSKLLGTTTLKGTPSGSVESVSFELLGLELMAISAGLLFRFNPSVSFLVRCGTKDEVGAIAGALSDGGTVLMELGAYPFSEQYAWVQDSYGLSWQIGLFDGPAATNRITPMILFVGEVSGKAEEAITLWTSVFSPARVDSILRYDGDEGPDKAGTVKQAAFSLLGQGFGAMDSAFPHRLAFNEAISFMVRCDTQREIDGYWERLSADPEAEQCGWLKDRFGLSWQIVPAALDEMLAGGDREKIARVTEALLKMKKLDLAELERAAEGR